MRPKNDRKTLGTYIDKKRNKPRKEDSVFESDVSLMHDKGNDPLTPVNSRDRNRDQITIMVVQEG